MKPEKTKSSLVAREERRLRVVFQRAMLIAVAGVGCGTTKVEEAASPDDGGAVEASVDASADAEAGPETGPDKCSSTTYTPAAPDTCGDYFTYPCGLPQGLTVRGDCYFAINDCNSLCPDIHYNCHAIVGYCSTNNGEAGVPVDAGDAGDGGVSSDGVVVPDEAGAVVIDCSICPGSAGRLPAGLVPVATITVPPGSSLLGAYFANAARLEAASVTAFHRLHDELALHDAPSELLVAAREAARDEVRHTLAMARLARRHGARYERPAVDDVAARSLAAIAEENVVEGCARETFSAVLATYQASASTDPRIAAVMTVIARDEARHAALSWAVARWSLARLDEADRSRIARAWESALDAVAVDDARADDLTRVAQLPSRGERVALAAQLRTLWTERLAA